MWSPAGLWLKKPILIPSTRRSTLPSLPATLWPQQQLQLDYPQGWWWTIKSQMFSNLINALLLQKAKSFQQIDFKARLWRTGLSTLLWSPNSRQAYSPSCVNQCNVFHSLPQSLLSINSAICVWRRKWQHFNLAVRMGTLEHPECRNWQPAGYKYATQCVLYILNFKSIKMPKK